MIQTVLGLLILVALLAASMTLNEMTAAFG
jgi:hypothetical protein